MQENGSNVPEVLQPAWAHAELVGPAGVTPLSALVPSDSTGLRSGSGPIAIGASPGDGVRVKNPSVLVYDIAGKGFTRLRGIVGLENPKSEIGSTLNPAIRFFVFDAAPNMERLVPPAPGRPCRRRPSSRRRPRRSIGCSGTRWGARRQLPSVAPRKRRSRDPSGGTRPSAQGLADLLWAVMMKPEFQLIY